MYLKRLHKTNPFANGARACAYASTHAGAEIFVQLVVKGSWKICVKLLA